MWVFEIEGGLVLGLWYALWAILTSTQAPSLGLIWERWLGLDNSPGRPPRRPKHGKVRLPCTLETCINVTPKPKEALFTNCGPNSSDCT